jgi:hypothetical protein
MNFSNNFNEPAYALHTSFRDSLEQSQLRVDSPSISAYRRHVVNENPVPEMPAPISPTLEKLTLDLRLSPWENKANMAMSQVSLRGQELRPRFATAKVA